MMNTIKARVTLSERTLVKSGNKKVYDIMLVFLDNVMLEIDKKFYSRDEAIEEMKRIVNILNAFSLKVKWSDLYEEIKENDKRKKNDKAQGKKEQAQSKDTDEKNREITGAARKEGNGSSIIPF